MCLRVLVTKINMLYYFILFCLVVNAISGQQQVFGGKCDAYKVSAVDKLDFKKYEGQWYELKRYENVDEHNLGCVTANFTKINETFIEIRLSGYNLSDHKATETTWQAVEEKQGSGKYNILNGKNPELKLPYWIVATDYQNYSVNWACNDIENTSNNIQGLWILSRSPTLQLEHVNAIENTLVKSGISTLWLKSTENDDKKCKSSGTISSFSIISLVFMLFTKAV